MCRRSGKANASPSWLLRSRDTCSGDNVLVLVLDFRGKAHIGEGSKLRAQRKYMQSFRSGLYSISKLQQTQKSTQAVSAQTSRLASAPT